MTIRTASYAQLEQSLEKARKAVARLKSRIRHINNLDDRHLVDLFIVNAESVIPKSIEEAGAELSDHVLGLRTSLGNLTFQDKYDDEDADDPISRTNDAIGNLSLSLDNVLKSAEAAGVVPSRPDLPRGSELPVPRDAVADRLDTLTRRLDEISAVLRDQVEPERAGANPREQAILNVVVKEIKTEVNLAKLVISGSMIDLTALTRAIEAIATLANSFVETARALGKLVRRSLVKAAERLREPVKKAVANVKGIFARAQKRILPPKPTAPPPDFDEKKVREIILSGRPVPPDWVPWVTELSFLGEKDLTDATPLAPLINLQVLDLSETQITDATPLAALINLQILDLSETQITDTMPLAGLINLRVLRLTESYITDATPLAGLINLRVLSLAETYINDATPLAGLHNLDTLILSGTLITDTKHLAGLSNLGELSLWKTQITDVKPLSGLDNLQFLDLGETQITDATPLAGLVNLQILDLSGTRITDAAPLAELVNLQTLYLEDTYITDVYALTNVAHLSQIEVGSREKAEAFLPQLGAGWRVEKPEHSSWYFLRRNVPGVEVD